MALFLRRRLTCFYCGARSKQPYSRDLRQWPCEACEATNHLDATGQPTEPPPARTPPVNPRFARPVAPAAAAEADDASLFCQTCLNNQAHLTRSLANYLPAPEDPQYAQYEATYPVYRQSLEERYPQVCAACEGRVQRRIQEAGYAAKADHLRRVMARAKDSRQAAANWTFRWRLAWIGGFLWTAALLGHLAWHGLGTLREEAEDGMRDDSPAPKFQACALEVFKSRQIDPRCVETARPWTTLLLILAIVSAWWNPVMGFQILTRVTGLGEYYKQQCVLLLVRVLGWYLLQRGSRYELDTDVERALQGVMLVLNIIIPVTSIRAIQSPTEPRVSFTPDERAASAAHFPRQDQQLVADKHAAISTTSTTKRSFPVSALAATTPKAIKTPSRFPPTPPSDDGSSNAMDLDTPTRPVQLNSPLIRRQRQDEQPAPSPFQGQLPLAPTRRWQNVSRDPQKVNPKENQPLLPAGTTFGFRGPALRGRPTAGPETDHTTPQMARPKFFAPESVATGLENLFSGFLSFDNAPPELRQAAPGPDGPYPTPSSTPPSSGNPPAVHRYRHFITSLFLLLACAIWYLASHFPPMLAPPLRLAALSIATAVPAMRLLAAVAQPTTGTDVLVLLIELLHGGALLAVTLRGGAGEVLMARHDFEMAQQAFLGVMVAQELVFLLVGTRTPTTVTVEPSPGRRATSPPAGPSRPAGDPDRDGGAPGSPVRDARDAPPSTQAWLDAQPARRGAARSTLDRAIAQLAPLPAKPAKPAPSMSEPGGAGSIGARVASRRGRRGGSPASSVGGGQLAGLSLGEDDGDGRGPGGRRQAGWQMGGL